MSSPRVCCSSFYIFTYLFLPPPLPSLYTKAFEFYDAVMDTVEKVLALASADELKEAEQLGSKIELPSFLFKKFEGEFYRPATP